jgi:hypothetical protein
MKTITAISEPIQRRALLSDLHNNGENENLNIEYFDRDSLKISRLRFALILLMASLFSWNTASAQCGYNYHAHQSRNIQLQKKAAKKMKRAKGDLVNFSCVSETKSKSAIRARKRLSRQSGK